ncbi:MAG TPA: hypothetical protein PKM73_02505 [Verrucomicrobiota bacterium]|nr:hypothetical protein [Verrucomicrobiota bacterium]HNU49784.1 hypothetical protein [Verrucomicrobiota bacterium]
MLSMQPDFAHAGRLITPAPTHTAVRPFRFLCWAAVVTLAAGFFEGSADSYTWTAGSRYDANGSNDNNLWSNPANWSPHGVPGAGDTASVGSTAYGNPDPVGNLTLANLTVQGGATVTVTSLTVDTLTLANGNLLGGTVQFSGNAIDAWTWDGGTISGTFQIQGGVRAHFAGSNSHVFSPSTTLHNNGEIAWSDGPLHFGHGSALRNAGTFLITNNQILFPYTGGTPAPVFENAGTLRKSASSGTTTFRADNGGITFTNRAIVDLQTGTLSLPARSDFGHGGSLAGPGTCSLEGTAGFHGTTTLAADVTLRLSGTLEGTDALLSGTGTLRWTGGTLEGTLTLDSSLTCSLEGNAPKFLATQTHVLQRGPARWQDAGQFNLAWGARWENTGHFDILNDAVVFCHTGGNPTPQFVNAGTLRKSASSGTTTFRADNNGVRFSGGGSVEVHSGTLQLDGGGTLEHPAFQVAPGTLLGFGGRTFLVQSGVAFSGGGLARINGASLTLDGSTCDVGPTTTFELASGTFDCHGTFSGSGLFLWSGGALGGSLDIPASLAFEMAGANTKTFLPHAALTNHADAAWSGTGNLNLAYGSAFHNLGSLDIRNDQLLFCHTGGTPVPVFENAGVLRKSASTGTTTFRADNGGIHFTNRAIVDLQTGTLSLPARSDFGHGGSLAGPGTCSLEGTAGFHGTTTLAADVTLRLSGTLEGTDALLSGTGTLRWTGGTLEGTLTLDSSLTCSLEGNAPKFLATQTHVLQRGPARWQDAGQFNLAWGARWENTGHFDILNDAVVFCHTGGNPTPQFVNTGTLRKSVSSGTTTIRADNGGVTLVNHGTVDIRTGRLQIDGGYQPRAGAAFSFMISGPAPGLEYGSVGRNGMFPFTGPLTVTLAAGYTPAPGTVFTLAHYSAPQGGFDPVVLPPLPEPMEWALRYLPSHLELRALAGEPVLEITQAEWLAPGIFQGLVVGAHVNGVLIEATTDFASWSPVATQTPFEGSLTFTDPDSGTFTNRVYRARELP